MRVLKGSGMDLAHLRGVRRSDLTESTDGATCGRPSRLERAGAQRSTTFKAGQMLFPLPPSSWLADALPERATPAKQRALMHLALVLRERVDAEEGERDRAGLLETRVSVVRDRSPVGFDPSRGEAELCCQRPSTPFSNPSGRARSPVGRPGSAGGGASSPRSLGRKGGALGGGGGGGMRKTQRDGGRRALQWAEGREGGIDAKERRASLGCSGKLEEGRGGA